MNDRDAYFQSNGFESAAAWEAERQRQCDEALRDFKEIVNSDKMNDPDERRNLFVMMRTRFQNWIDWIKESQA